ncbi:MAG TPA: IMP cyclohydrolase [Rectinemataceae bacterium]|nr:IMP cyclohydrolase [Rectinemataceae bacterium]
MSGRSLSSAYRAMAADPFPGRMELSFYDEGGRRTALVYEKVRWEVEGERRGLRYGENPDQSAALYRPVGGNLSLGGALLLEPGEGLVSAAELLQFGKHPGKINLTDVDSALGILRYLSETPACAVIKHNNPSGVALGASVSEAYRRAYLADRVAAFGGAVVVNRSLDLACAEAIAASYCEVVAAPDYEEGAIGVLAGRKNLRIMRIPAMERLEAWALRAELDFKSLLDGSLIVQTSFVSRIRSREDFLGAECERQGGRHAVLREPTEAEWKDMLFGWLVETGVTSNSVIYVKDGVTVGIGTGEQDRVGVAEIARDKAYRKLEDRLLWERSGLGWNESADEAAKAAVREEVRELHGGLSGSVMISDAFFPFRDGIDVGLREGVSAVVQPGGSVRDDEVIEACNEYGAAMKFTGQRCFRH